MGQGWVKTTRAEPCEYQTGQLVCAHVLTAIESFKSCGRLESFSAADAAEAKRIDMQLARGARNAAHTRFEEIRNAIVACEYCGKQNN